MGLRTNGVAIHVTTVIACVTALLIDHGKQNLLISKKFVPKERWAYLWLSRKKLTDRAVTKATAKKKEDPKVLFI